MNNKTDGAGSYGRDIVYLYLPIGIEFSNKVNSGFSWTAGGEYDIFAGGTATSHLSDLSPGTPDIVHNQSSGGGLRMRAGAEWNLIAYVLTAQAFYQSWSIDASDVAIVRIKNKQAALVEPQNNTAIFGLTIGAKF